MASTSTFLTLPLAKPFLPKGSTFSPSTQRFTALQRNSLKINAIAKPLEPTKVVPQGDRVLIALQDLPDKTAGGVLLPKSAVKFERYLVGEILSVGAEVGELEVGKKVLFSDINAYEVDLGNDAKHCFCKASDLLAVVE
ncbi:PREDICTED: 10 kDa chaperonin 1, chloroplastic-like [Lupinus angustifolius]|uniref:10 kDa chaperonin 1, chloroplastic-like n=1 Tax=Lupinus angustifolius TaxID=3871 RepID=UPI00092E3EA2|nr:PREDICTED: 10 kDa chaperonin 1, chloroplastic-like [Lupinus angustifolius]